MTEKTILIIGAGIAGLSTGCYAQMNGYRTRIFELGTNPGGLCTSWSRKGYTFDGCIHWLVGTKEKTSFNKLWQELGALQGKQIINHEEYLRVVDRSGKTFILYTNPDRLEEHLLQLSPIDAPVIKEFTGNLRTIAQAEIPLGAPSTLKESIQMLWSLPKALPLLRLLRKYSTVSVQDFTARIQDPFVKEALLSAFNLPDFPLVGAMMSLGWMAAGNAGYPIGGSLNFAQGIEKKYLALGGKVTYHTRVTKILVEGGKAVGIRLDDGTEYRADIVISAADGHATLFDMLGGDYMTDQFRHYYNDMPIFSPLIQVSLGINRDLSNQPFMTSYSLKNPLMIAGEERQRLGFKHFCFDPTLAPAGKSVVEVTYSSNFDYWKEIAEEPERYQAEKKDIAIKVIDQLNQIYPGLSDEVEVVDVATPLTYERFTGNWQGSMEGWRISTQNFSQMTSGKGLSKTLPGLENFYMTGQWVEPGGGIPTAAASGRKVMQLICKTDHRPFKTAVPGTRS